MTWQQFKNYLKKIKILAIVGRKIRLVFVKIKSLEYFYELVRRLFRAIDFFNWRLVRKLYFDLSNGFLLSDCEHESFIVSAQDNAIGKRVFVTKEPFEIDKLYTVMSLLPLNNKYTTFVDVGANIGVTCLPAIKRKLFERAVAIEPDNLNYTLLKSNVALNNAEEFIQIHNCALGETVDAKVAFEKSEQNYGDHRVRKTARSGDYNEELRSVINVASTTLDSLLQKDETIRSDNIVLWIDTQGFEGHILSGAKNTLKSLVPLCVEFWPYGMARADSYKPFIKALESLNYKEIYDLKRPTKAMPFSKETFDKIYSELGEYRHSYTDLLIL